MGDPYELPPQTTESKNILPDVVHSQQIPAVGTAVADETETLEIDTGRNTEGENPVSHDVENISETESISEHIPKMEYSVTESDNAAKTHESQGILKVEGDQEKISKHSSLNIPYSHSPFSDRASTHDHSLHSSSWPLDAHVASDVHPLSEESPVILASSDFSKEGGTNENKSQEPTSQQSNKHESPREDEDVYLDSLNEEASQQTNISIGEDNSLQSSQSEKQESDKSSGSEEIIKLDIRGKGVPKIPLTVAKLIFGPPPEGSTVIGPDVEHIPVFPNLLSPFLVGAGDSMKVEEVFDDVDMPFKDPSLVRSPEPSNDVSPEISMDASLEKSYSSDKVEQDVLVEEVTVDYDRKEKDQEIPEKLDDTSIPTQPKSIPLDETMSFSTLTTDYKTICEEYHVKLVHLEDAITQRDELIEELTVSLQRSVREQDDLRTENAHLTNEVQNLQHIVAEHSHSDHDTIKAQISDFIKYETLVKDDSTKFYSALMSGGSSIQSSNGEKDNDREEITVNYSRSDLKSSSSDDFPSGFENKLATVLNTFDEYIEENLRNKLRESVIQVLCNEIGKMRIESDTELREVETQMQQDKQTYTVETRRLRELLASVKAGNADIDALRQELNIKHEKEMENLRTYFEKKCSDMERSYSEEVWRGRTCASPAGSALSAAAGDAGGAGGAEPDAAGAAGDCARRRTRSAEFPSLTLEPVQLDQSLKQMSRRYEQQIEELKTEHTTYTNELQARHREAIAALEEQVTQLKAHIQTSENTEANVSLYQQDIDLELEKRVDKDYENRLEEVRQQVAQQLQEQIQVLLSDPDAEVSSWPLELVALREKIHETREKELSNVREEAAAGEADKWKQRRNLSFDQNRQLDEVTKERDGLRRVAVALQRAVSQLLAYCACAEDEINRTVLAQLLTQLQVKDESSIQIEEDSRPSTPNLDLSTSLVSRGKHVHFAPDLPSLLTELDEAGLAGFLAEQRDLSADIKRELELSLKRLRHEAHELLDMSAKLAANRPSNVKMLESGDQVQITELVQELDAQQNKNCDNCELHRKSMEEAMAECLQRENLLRSDLEAAMMKIAQLMTSADRMHSSDLIAEGYGTAPPLQPLSLPGRGSPRPRPASDGTLSLDGSSSPRLHLTRMQHELDTVQRERDDLHQQVKRMTDSPVHKICCEKLEAANRQLRATRQFVEEQASERETERDEFAARLAELRDENARLATRLQNNARILNEVEQLEAQTREMNQIIAELESRKVQTDEEIKSYQEKITLLRDIIANLENQLEQKTTHESEVLEQLDQMKKTIDERDNKMRSLIGELESLKSEKADQSDLICVKCGQDDDRYETLMENLKEQTRWLEEKVHRSTQRLERIHEVASTSCSEPSEDVSLRDQKNRNIEVCSPMPASPRVEVAPPLAGLLDCLQAHARAEDAALKRIADLEMQRTQLKDVAQEVRAERDVLQARMSEQALKISSLSARLQQQRNDADALAQQAASQLTVQLHDTLAEVQRLKEELESKDKQLIRMRQTMDEKDKLNEQHQTLYGNTCNPKDKVIILERELSSAQTRIAQLESLARSLETDKEELQTALRDHQRALAEKEDQLQELLALNLDDNQKEERSEVVEGKASARTLSDIVSISEFDEQDLQMRRAELKAQNLSISGAPYETNKTLNRTLPPEVQKPNLSSLNIDYGDHFDFTTYSPRADSLPAHLTSTQNKEFLKQYKRNVNETTIFGATKQSEHNIPDNCSMYPNRDVNDSKEVTVEPKKINFSLEVTNDNKTQNDEEEFTSLRELGITLDIRQENFPDILTQLKHEIKKSRTELDKCKSELKNAEEQLCEFPALKEEVEELKGLLENTMATMDNDKKFYENQLENFTSNKKLLEQRLSELTQEVNDKSKDLHLLKEDILRRENMILELAKEKRNLTNKMTELEVKIDELQSRNGLLEKYENENHQMREKITELQKLEQLVSEKNQQIDSLNQHLDRLDDLQRCLNDKTEEFENLKELFEEKSNEIEHMQDTVEALNRDVAKLNEDNNALLTTNKDLKLKLTKIEKEQENASIKLQNSETELERVNSLNNELTSKIEELKLLTDKLKDKETEIEILHEDINSYHEEIASLKEQMKMVSRSPSPRNKSSEEKKTPDRHASNDKKQLVKIRKQISLLQHELDFNKKELNDKAFELAKAKLDVTELKNTLSQTQKHASDRETTSTQLKQRNEELELEVQAMTADREQLKKQLETVVARIREESSLTELKAKLHEKTERCQELENELQDLKDLVDRLRESSPVALEDQKALVVSGTRSPTAELERALRDQLNYSHTLDEDIMEQILSASSDERDDIPRLALNTSKSSSSIHSSSSERLHRLRSENERLLMQVNNLELRLKDKDALITELNRVRDKLLQDWQSSKLRLQAERDNSGRLQLLLDTQKETSESLQNQDSNMIQILKKRLESSMKSELELQQRDQQQRARIAQLERQLLTDADDAGNKQLQHELENNERLKGEISLLKSKLEVEHTRYVDLQALLDYTKLQMQRDLDAKNDTCAALRSELADLKRLKHDAGVELLRAKELLNIQSSTISELEKKLTTATLKQRPVADALTEIETHKLELAREISTLKKCLVETSAPELAALRADRAALQARLSSLEGARAPPAAPDERDHAIRYLHGRCLRLESCRKALVWQKRYLQRVLAGYAEFEKNLHVVKTEQPTSGRRRFRSAAKAVVAVLRMEFLVRRRHHVRALSAACILRPRGAPPGAATPTAYSPASPPGRERPAARDSQPRRPPLHDLRLHLPSSPAVNPFITRSPYATNSPRDEPFILSTPRGEVASAYLHKLDAVSRCLNRAMDAARDTH
ncbi:major antigen-like isoform X4 [Pectinophora gossypiella]|uniref:major antigen-like isoform X4 n=1 Tax=Pectinophora gossypiella TaxID=13191 RepID=UPI00214F08FC|nr:major antigen-like isoform X4 [Pectinophora gossypiella]